MEFLIFYLIVSIWYGFSSSKRDRIIAADYTSTPIGDIGEYIDFPKTGLGLMHVIMLPSIPVYLIKCYK